MIVGDHFHIRSTESGRYMQHWWKSQFVSAEESKFIGVWPRKSAERNLAARCKEFAGDYELIPIAACGCCARSPAKGDECTIHQVFSDGDMHIWRCDKHLGRNPCIIPACGVTFAHRNGTSYQTSFICGKHWRQAPKFMRDAVIRVERLAKRRKGAGWTETLRNRHSRLWYRTIRAVIDGHRVDMTEINKMFGWDA